MTCSIVQLHSDRAARTVPLPQPYKATTGPVRGCAQPGLNAKVPKLHGCKRGIVTPQPVPLLASLHRELSCFRLLRSLQHLQAKTGIAARLTGRTLLELATTTSTGWTGEPGQTVPICWCLGLSSPDFPPADAARGQWQQSRICGMTGDGGWEQASKGSDGASDALGCIRDSPTNANQAWLDFDEHPIPSGELISGHQGPNHGAAGAPTTGGASGEGG